MRPTMIYTRATCEETATCSRALFAPNSPPPTPTSQSMMRPLCHYCNNAITDGPLAVTTSVWCTLGDILSKSASFIYSFIFFGWGEKINKWWSNTVYANLISHASYVRPRFLGGAQPRLRGEWQRRGLIWLISSVMIMRLSTLFVVCTKGHMNKKKRLRRTLWASPFLARLIQIY